MILSSLPGKNCAGRFADCYAYLISLAGRKVMSDENAISLEATVSDELLLKSEEISQDAKQLGSELEKKYYVPLAMEADTGKPENKCFEAADLEIKLLNSAAKNLLQSYHTVTTLEDELKARAHDAKRVGKRKIRVLNPPANGAIDLEEERKDHFAKGLNIYKLLLLLAAGSFAGVMVEMLWCFLRHGYLESRRGLVYGPFNLLYGVGAILLTITLYRFRNRGYLWSFMGGFVVGSVLEYLCSWFQELLLGSRSWDYSNMPFNLNGRICLAYSMFWGVLGVLWIKDLYPRAAKLILRIPNRAGKIITIIIAVFFVFDAAVTAVALARWSLRIEGKPATNAVVEFIDERFPDERMERIFANMEFNNSK